MKDSLSQVTANTENTHVTVIEQLIDEVTVELVEDVNDDLIMESKFHNYYQKILMQMNITLKNMSLTTRCIAESQHKSPPCTPVKEKDQTSDSEAAKADVEII